MARDSSPFAKRLKKAISPRSAGQAPDADPASQEQTASETGDTFAPEQPSAAAAPDEQPTGEFPAVSAPDAAGPVPDAPVEPLGSNPVNPESTNPVADDEQPTGEIPAIAPSWLDPPAADPIAPPSTAGVDQSGTPAEDPVLQVDWSTPADDVYEPISDAPAAESSVPASPYLPDPPAPVWEAEAASADSPSSDAPLPIWESIDASSPAGDASADTRPAEPPAQDATPAWAEEAEAIGEPAGPVVPAPFGRYETSSPDSETAEPSDGPTLSPPVLSKRTDESAPQAVDPSGSEAEPGAVPPQTDDAHDAALAALPDESEPEWTPTALHEALSLDEDDAPSTSEATSSTSDADASEPTALSADEFAEPARPESSEAAQAPVAKRGFRSAFGRRKREEAAPDVSGDDVPLEHDEAATASADLTPSSDPATSVHAAVPTPADEPSSEVPATTSDANDEPSSPTDDAEASGLERTDDPVEPPADPGSITSRFAAIGRRALSRKEAKAAAAAAAAQAQADTAGDDDGTLPAATPEPESGTVATETVVAPLADYKPTFAERAALRRRVKSLRARRDAGLAELGAIVLDQSRFGDPTGGTLVRRRTALLADLDSEIAAIEAALDESGPPEAVAQLGVVHCQSCSALVGPADRFCAACGTARPAADAGAALTGA